MTFLIDHTQGTHDCVDAKLRDLHVCKETLQKLIDGRTIIRSLLHDKFSELFEDYLRRLNNDTVDAPTDEKLIDRNSRLACCLHTHKLLLYRNYHQHELTACIAKTLVGSFVYLTTRHTWNKTNGLEKDKESTTTGRSCPVIPETSLYELLTVQRRRILSWVSSCRQGVV